MSQLSHAQLIIKIIATVFENSGELITGEALQELLLDFNDSITNVTDAGIIISSGFVYWKGNPASPVTGDRREGYVAGSDSIELQNYNGTSWDTLSSR